MSLGTLAGCFHPKIVHVTPVTVILPTRMCVSAIPLAGLTQSCSSSAAIAQSGLIVVVFCCCCLVVGGFLFVWIFFRVHLLFQRGTHTHAPVWGAFSHARCVCGSLPLLPLRFQVCAVWLELLPLPCVILLCVCSEGRQRR